VAVANNRVKRDTTITSDSDIGLDYHNSFGIKYNSEIYCDNHLPLMGKEMLSPYLLELEAYKHKR